SGGNAVFLSASSDGADTVYLSPPIAQTTGVNGTDLIAYTWQIGNGFSASVDVEDSGNGQNNPLAAAGVGSVGTPGTGRGKVLINTSIPSSLGSVATGSVFTNDALRSMQPDLVGNLRADQAWGSAQIMLSRQQP